MLPWTRRAFQGLDRWSSSDAAAPVGPAVSYALTRFVLLRLLALVYFVAFLVLVRQLEPLIGSHGLLPAASFLDQVRRASGTPVDAFLSLPTLFWFGCSDRALDVLAWTGLGLSAAALLGATNAVLQLALWALYLSFVQIGQLFYGYGWETQLLETGFLAVFLCPVRSIRPFPDASPPVAIIWLFRWLIARIMLGAAAIKLRGDPCWRDFTCLVYHYETQPIPNPLSWWLSAQPRWFHMAGVAVNHYVELVAPFFLLGTRRLRLAAGLSFVGFQIILILSGNLSFLNWLTIVPALACFDDRFLARLFPRGLRERIAARAEVAAPSALHRAAAGVLVAVVAVLSINPVRNLLSPHQAMNRSYDPLHLVNTYGAFGAVGRERYEVILSGTSDAQLGPNTEWREYEFPCKPGDVMRRPCVISPYHYRLDWQLWFAAMSSIRHEPWLLHFVDQLLVGDPGAVSLLARNPFPDAPPRYIRADLYRYQFTRPGDGSRAWWRRSYAGPYLAPVSHGDPDLQQVLRLFGWSVSEPRAPDPREPS